MVIQVSSYRRNRSPSVESRRHVTAGPTSPSADPWTGRKGPSTMKPFTPIPTQTSRRSANYGGTGTRPPTTPNPRCRPMREHQHRLRCPGPYRRSDGVSDPNSKAPHPARLPEEPPRSAAQDQPASEVSETESDNEGLGPTHTPGSGRAEPKISCIPSRSWCPPSWWVPMATISSSPRHNVIDFKTRYRARVRHSVSATPQSATCRCGSGPVEPGIENFLGEQLDGCRDGNPNKGRSRAELRR